MRLAEAAVFIILAGAIHAAAAIGLSDLATGGAAPEGDGGTAPLTLQAAPDSLAALAERWDSPPDPGAAPDGPAEPVADATPEGPAMPARPAPMAPPPALSGLAEDSPPAPAPALPAPATLSPAPPEAPGLPVPAADGPPPTATVADAPLRTTGPVRPLAGAAPDLPRIDTESAAAPGRAPDRSLRPEARTARAQPTAPARTERAATVSRRAPAAQGSGTTRRPKAAPAAPGPSKAAQERARTTWGAGIRTAVARAQRYPRGTTATGVVQIRISVTPAGRLAGVRILRSSGDAVLDRAALRAAQSARLPRAPGGLNASAYSFNLPLNFARR